MQYLSVNCKIPQISLYKDNAYDTAMNTKKL